MEGVLVGRPYKIFEYEKELDDLWQDISEASTRYENLGALALQNQEVKFEDGQRVFLITPPSKINAMDSDSNGENRYFLGWRLFLYAPGGDVKRAYNLAAPIIREYGLCVQVANVDDYHGSRISVAGGQIIIFLEEGGRSVITPNEAEELITKIHIKFSKNFGITDQSNCNKSRKPRFAAETAYSEFVSISNNAVKPRLWGAKDGYCAADEIGKHFNPFNNKNPFNNLLIRQAESFDPLEHFKAFDSDSIHSYPTSNNSNGFDREKVKVPLFYLTLYAYVREYTNIDELDERAQHDLIYDNCAEGAISNLKPYMKKSARNRPSIQIGVMIALRIMLNFYEDEKGQEPFLKYVYYSQPSQLYLYKDTYRTFLMEMEEYAEKNTKKEWTPVEEFSLVALPFQSMKLESRGFTDTLSKDERHLVIQNGHFLNVSAVVKKCRSEGWEAILELFAKYEEVPAVQLEIADAYAMGHFGYERSVDLSEYWYLKALTSADAKYIHGISETMDTILYVSILMKYLDKGQIAALTFDDNEFAKLALRLVNQADFFPKFPCIGKFRNADLIGDNPEIKTFSLMPDRLFAHVTDNVVQYFIDGRSLFGSGSIDRIVTLGDNKHVSKGVKDEIFNQVYERARKKFPTESFWF